MGANQVRGGDAPKVTMWQQQYSRSSSTKIGAAAVQQQRYLYLLIHDPEELGGPWGPQDALVILLGLILHKCISIP